MKRRVPIRFLLDDPDGGRVIRFLSQQVELAEGTKRTWVTVTRTGSFTDPRYGRFEITPRMLADMVRNFEAGTYGQDVFIDVAHAPDQGAAGKVLQLKADGNRLRAEVEWTPYGLAAVREKGFRYLSADFYDDYIDNEEGQSHGPLLRGAGLTIRPVIKRLDPVTLAEPGNATGPVLLSPGLVHQLTETLETAKMKWLEELRNKLRNLKLSEALVASLLKAAEAAAKQLGEDETALKSLAAEFENTGKQIADASKSADPADPVQLSVNVGLTEAKVKELMEAQAKQQADSAKQLAEKQKANEAAFAKALEEAKGLSETTRKELTEAVGDLVTAEMTEDQVKRFAESQIALGHKMEASRQLASMGFAGPRGTPHITLDESNAVKQLAETMRTRMLATAEGMSKQLALPEVDKVSPFAAKVLAEFDARHARHLHIEAKMLAGGTDTGHTDLPASFQRQVILEALHDLRILDLVTTNVDPTQSATHNIPYETRRTETVHHDGIVYEGQPVPKAGVKQEMDLAYIQPVKIAMELTNEVIFFTRNNANIDWEAWARNVASNSRLSRELIVRRLANDMQRNADMFGSEAVTSEALTAQVNGTRNQFKTAHFPIVRPFQARDLKGAAIGDPEAPITVLLDGNPIAMFDGSGTQDAGTYFEIVNWNLGYLRVVNQAGAVQTPANETPLVISYTRSHNRVLVDLDVPSGVTLERHMNKLLQAFGARKAILDAERFVQPNFFLCSPVLEDQATNAETFAANFRRDGTATDMQGDLNVIKKVPGWKTNAPGIDLGDERILIGERGVQRYTVAKPWSMASAPFEIFNSQGQPLATKGAYAEEYSSLKLPTPLRGRLTSLIAYSVTARAAV